MILRLKIRPDGLLLWTIDVSRWRRLELRRWLGRARSRPVLRVHWCWSDGLLPWWWRWWRHLLIRGRSLHRRLRLLPFLLFLVHAQHCPGCSLPLARVTWWVASTPSPQIIANPHADEATEYRDGCSRAIWCRGHTGKAADIHCQQCESDDGERRNPGDGPIEGLPETACLPPAQKIDERNDQPHCVRTPFRLLTDLRRISLLQNRTEYVRRQPRVNSEAPR